MNSIDHVKLIAHKEGFNENETDILINALENVENGLERFINDYYHKFKTYNNDRRRTIETKSRK